MLEVAAAARDQEYQEKLRKKADSDVRNENGASSDLKSVANASRRRNVRKFTLITISPKQRRALKASYVALKSGGSWLKLFEQIFRHLESKCPEIRSIFLTTAFVNSLRRERDTPPLVKTEHDHCKCLVMIIEDLIYSDDLDEAILTLRLYGEKHAQMRESGFTPQMIEQFGEIAVSVIVAQDIIKYNHEAVKAWRLFLACVTDEMRVGYEKHSKMSERRSSRVQ